MGSSFRLHEAAEELRRLDELQEEKPAKPGARIDPKTRGREERQAIKMRLEIEGEFELAAKLARCGLPVPLVCTCCGHGKIVETRCKKRWCPACAWSVMRERMERFEGAVAMMRWPLFVTLTQPNSTDPESVRQLRENWGKMRRRKALKDRIAGGVASIEVTNRGNGWHPHLHIICDCEWLAIHTPAPLYSDSPGVRAQKLEHAKLELTALWSNVIGSRDAVTWIKRVSDASFLKYCLKYSVKGSELVSSPDAIGPLLKVMERSRLVSAFGNLHGRTAEMTDDEVPCAQCSECGNEKSFLPVDVIRGMTRIEPERLAVPVHFGSDFRAGPSQKMTG